MKSEVFNKHKKIKSRQCNSKNFEGLLLVQTHDSRVHTTPGSHLSTLILQDYSLFVLLYKQLATWSPKICVHKKNKEVEFYRDSFTFQSIPKVDCVVVVSYKVEYGKSDYNYVEMFYNVTSSADIITLLVLPAKMSLPETLKSTALMPKIIASFS